MCKCQTAGSHIPREPAGKFTTSLQLLDSLGICICSVPQGLYVDAIVSRQHSKSEPLVELSDRCFLPGPEPPVSASCDHGPFHL